MTWYMVWPTGHGMVFDMAWRAWQDIWYGHIMVYGMVWEAWHCLLNGLTCMAWYLVWPGVVYSITWVDMA